MVCKGVADLERVKIVPDLDMNLVNIDDFGGWNAAYQTYFNFKDGAVFDHIYAE